MEVDTHKNMKTSYMPIPKLIEGLTLTKLLDILLPVYDNRLQA